MASAQPKPDFNGKQGRQDSNLQPPVLETGALPIELRPSGLRERLYPRPYRGLADDVARFLGCDQGAGEGRWPGH
jgi:hypothetical protein